MPDKDEEVVHYEIYFKELKNNSDSGSPFDHESVSSTNNIDLTIISRKCEGHWVALHWQNCLFTSFLELSFQTSNNDEWKEFELLKL